jgi:hypothetical protein
LGALEPSHFTVVWTTTLFEGQKARQIDPPTALAQELVQAARNTRLAGIVASGAKTEKVLVSQIDLDARKMRRALQVPLRNGPDALGRPRLNKEQRGDSGAIIVNIQFEDLHDAPPCHSDMMN